MGEHYNSKGNTRTKRHSEESWLDRRHTITPWSLQCQHCHPPEDTCVQLLRAASHDVLCRYLLDSRQIGTEQTCGSTDQNGNTYAQQHTHGQKDQRLGRERTTVIDIDIIITVRNIYVLLCETHQRGLIIFSAATTCILRDYKRRRGRPIKRRRDDLLEGYDMAADKSWRRHVRVFAQPRDITPLPNDEQWRTLYVDASSFSFVTHRIFTPFPNPLFAHILFNNDDINILSSSKFIPPHPCQKWSTASLVFLTCRPTLMSESTTNMIICTCIDRSLPTCVKLIGMINEQVCHSFSSPVSSSSSICHAFFVLPVLLRLVVDIWRHIIACLLHFIACTGQFTWKRITIWLFPSTSENWAITNQERHMLCVTMVS